MSLNLNNLLNTQQAHAASQIAGPVLIIAGAGSGKTRMICYRIAHMLEQGIDQSNILALTFTNKAAREMAVRVRELTDNPLPSLLTSTFHAFGLRVLKEYGHMLGYKHNFTIYDSADRLSLLREVLIEENLDPHAMDIDAMLQLFSEVKTGRGTWPESSTRLTKALYDAYHDHMRLYNAFDFDDLLMLPSTLFDRYPHILSEYQNRFQYIMVDEFQDTSLEQYKLVHMLAREHRNLCVVGDDDQSIYSWRGANYQNIMLFESDFPEFVEITLERNYRSTGTILQAANELIVNNKQRKEKSLWTDSGSGGRIVLLHPEDEEDEIRTIVSEMRRISFEESTGWNSFGILVRTNHLIPAIEQTCMLEQIPITVSGGQSFFERKEVKDILAYLRVLANPDDDMALLRIINTPRRKIGRTSLQKIRSVAEEQRCSLFSAIGMIISPETSIHIPRVEPLKEVYDLIDSYRTALFTAGRKKSSVLNALIEEIGYKAHLASEYPGNEQAAIWRFKSVETFVHLFRRWERDEENSGGSIYDYLHTLSLHARDQAEDGSDTDSVSIMTMHASKGLEFDTVFLVGIEDHIIPHARTLEENPDALEEERRLFYVAITRARRLLFISSCSQRKRNREVVTSSPSRFIEEISPQLFEQQQEDRELDQEETLAAFEALRRTLAAKGG